MFPDVLLQRHAMAPAHHFRPEVGMRHQHSALGVPRPDCSAPLLHQQFPRSSAGKLINPFAWRLGAAESGRSRLSSIAGAPVAEGRHANPCPWLGRWAGR